MSKNLLAVILGLFFIGLTSCNINTPEIRGVVLDEETKQPVAEAWVRATMEVYTKTIAGNVHRGLSIDKPHTRTDKEGGFIIPSRSFKKPGFPKGFGTEVTNLAIGASTVDDTGGRVNLKEEKLKEILGKKKVEITIYTKPVERTEEEYFSHLQSLYNYCLTGRSSVEVPPVEGGCDEWELNYAIAKHERYLIKHRKLAEEGRSRGYGTALEQLADLYEKKGNIRKAIDTLKDKVTLMEKRGLLKFPDWRRDKENLERRIKEFQRKLPETQE
jgi:hypothetical protein